MSTTSQLRNDLFKDMKDLRDGKVDVKTSRQLTKVASAINQSLRFDIENKRENIRLMKATASKKYKDVAPKPLII